MRRSGLLVDSRYILGSYCAILVLASLPGCGQTLDVNGRDPDPASADDLPLSGIGSLVLPTGLEAVARGVGLQASPEQFRTVVNGADGQDGAPLTNVAFARHAWDQAQLIEHDDVDRANDPHMAMDLAGNAITVWQQHDSNRMRIWANRYRKRHGWGRAQLIESDNMHSAFNPRVAMDSAGNAIAVWEQYDETHSSIWANRYVVGSGWGTAQLIEDNTDDAHEPQVALDPAGNAVAVWSQGTGNRWHIWANRYVVENGWDAAQIVEHDNEGIARQPQVAINAAGSAVAVWQQYDGASERIWANWYKVGSGWGLVEPIEADGDSPRNPQAVIDPVGNALVVWAQGDFMRSTVWARRFVAGTGWGPAQDIASDYEGMAYSPKVAMDSAGNALVVWDGRIGANHFTTRHGWGRAQPIEMEDLANEYGPQVAIGAGGIGLAVWAHAEGIRGRIAARRYQAGRGWGAAQLISTNDVGFAQDPQVAMDAAGHAITVWEQSNGSCWDIWASRSAMHR